jgi:hypothetical protein
MFAFHVLPAPWMFNATLLTAVLAINCKICQLPNAAAVGTSCRMNVSRLPGFYFPLSMTLYLLGLAFDGALVSFGRHMRFEQDNVPMPPEAHD